ncbi:hypothetical protein ACFLWX_00305 [Chloroflexota bacterium]
MRLDPLEIIKTAREYGLRPHGLKAEAFTLFKQGYTAGEAYLLMKRRATLGTLHSYHVEWINAKIAD